MSNAGYRPEIDGLRAVAVMGVVLFHAGLGFPGGFVGVDVFFVISGYLITGLICKKLDSNSFSLLDFWAKRIRRILPAVTVMVLAVILAGLYLLDPSGLRDLSESSTYQSIMLANIYFWKNTGYFTRGADYTPLLHTWTLAVEEQFYVFFPILLVVLWRYFQRKIFIILFLGTIASLGVSIYFTPVYPGASFFLLPPRAWELLAGALLSVSTKRALSRKSSEAMSLVGIAMICFAMFTYDEKVAFPGYHAIVPVVGAVLFIYSSSFNPTLVGKILSHKLIVFIGLISYSLYLWHWPLLSFSHILFGDFKAPMAWFIVALSIGLSYLSWRYIENPFRNGRADLPRHRVVWYGVAAVAVLFVSSLFIMISDGLPGRFTKDQLEIMEDVSWYGLEYESTNSKPVLIGDSGHDNLKEGLDFVIWGDSHAMAIGKLVDSLASEHGLVGGAYFTGGAIPVAGLSVVNTPNAVRALELERSEKILNSLLQQEVSNVILVARWSAYISGSGVGEIDAGQPWDKALVSNKIDNREASLEDTATSIAQQLELMLAKLADAGVKVWLVKQVPEIANVSAAHQFYISNRFPILTKFDSPTLTLPDHEFRQQGVNQMLESISLSGAIVVDPSKAFFNSEGKMITIPGRSLYRNDDHVTAFGAGFFMHDTFDSILSEIKGEGK